MEKKLSLYCHEHQQNPSTEVIIKYDESEYGTLNGLSIYYPDRNMRFSTIWELINQIENDGFKMFFNDYTYLIHIAQLAFIKLCF